MRCGRPAGRGAVPAVAGAPLSATFGSRVTGGKAESLAHGQAAPRARPRNRRRASRPGSSIVRRSLSFPQALPRRTVLHPPIGGVDGPANSCLNAGAATGCGAGSPAPAPSSSGPPGCAGARCARAVPIGPRHVLQRTRRATAMQHVALPVRCGGMSSLHTRSAARLPTPDTARPPLVPAEISARYAAVMARIPRVRIDPGTRRSTESLPAVSSFYG